VLFFLSVGATLLFLYLFILFVDEKKKTRDKIFDRCWLVGFVKHATLFIWKGYVSLESIIILSEM